MLLMVLVGDDGELVGDGEIQVARNVVEELHQLRRGVGEEKPHRKAHEECLGALAAQVVFRPDDLREEPELFERVVLREPLRAEGETDVASDRQLGVHLQVAADVQRGLRRHGRPEDDRPARRSTAMRSLHTARTEPRSASM